MKLAYVIPYVDDVALTLDFYERAFGVTRRFLHESGTYGEVETGATTLSFTARSLMRELGKALGQADPHAPVFEIAFATDDVPAAYSRAVAAGAVPMQDPAQMPWGQTVAYVSDPNGILVELCTPVGP
ncbi:MAG: VOC family protein [Rhodobacteraceae bacterium]|nr:VOC family protein [Paracoccaceae bacterium]